jgi:hypothetical protein
MECHGGGDSNKVVVGRGGGSSNSNGSSGGCFCCCFCFLVLDTWRCFIHPLAAQCNLAVDAFLLLHFKSGHCMLPFLQMMHSVDK